MNCSEQGSVPAQEIKFEFVEVAVKQEPGEFSLLIKEERDEGVSKGNLKQEPGSPSSVDNTGVKLEYVPEIKDIAVQGETVPVESDTTAGLGVGNGALVKNKGKSSNLQGEVSLSLVNKNVAGRQVNVSVSAVSFLCEVCSARFNNRWLLKEHILIHVDEKRYVCVLCSAKFRKREDLKEHTLTHTLSRPFACALCPMMFRSSSDLRQHALVHTDCKPFPCPSCPATFRHSSTLKKHKHLHTGEKPYACTICPQTFRYSNSRKLHMRHHELTDKL